jgi:hypothetical protein
MGKQGARSIENHGFRLWAGWVFAASHMLMFGLLIMCVASEVLRGQRPGLMQPPWNYVLFTSMIICIVWWLVATFPRFPEMSDDHSSGIEKITVIPLLSIAVLLLLIWLRNSEWSVLFVGLVAATFPWTSYSKAKWPDPVFACLGFCVAGPLALLVQWPNSQRFLVVFCIGGLATAVQGLLVVRRCYRRYKQRALEHAVSATA